MQPKIKLDISEHLSQKNHLSFIINIPETSLKINIKKTKVISNTDEQYLIKVSATEIEHIKEYIIDTWKKQLERVKTTRHLN